MNQVKGSDRELRLRQYSFACWWVDSRAVTCVRCNAGIIKWLKRIGRAHHTSSFDEWTSFRTGDCWMH